MDWNLNPDDRRARRDRPDWAEPDGNARELLVHYGHRFMSKDLNALWTWMEV